MDIYDHINDEMTVSGSYKPTEEEAPFDGLNSDRDTEIEPEYLSALIEEEGGFSLRGSKVKGIVKPILVKLGGNR